MGKIITISREYGSGGRELGKKLAERLGFEYCDKEVISEIAKEMDISEDKVRSIMHSRPRSINPFTFGQSLAYPTDFSYQQMQEVFDAHSKILNKIADTTDCVFIGRCADYILKDRNPFRIFVYADMDFKVNRCLNRDDNVDNLNAKQMKKQIETIEAQREKFYNYYTENKWGDKAYYDLMINNAKASVDQMADAITALFK